MNGFRLLAVLIPLFTSGGGSGIPAPAWTPDYHVSPTGSALNDGLTQATAWSLDHFRTGAGGLAVGGKKIGFWGGIYADAPTTPTDVFLSIAGTAGNRIDCRAMPGQFVRINGMWRQNVGSNYVDFRFMHFFWDDGVNLRHSAIGGSGPADIPRNDKGVSPLGKFNRYFWCTFSQYDDGFFSGSSLDAEGNECHFCISFGNGYDDDVLHVGWGHGFYLQNVVGAARKGLFYCVAFANYGYNGHIFTSEAGQLVGFIFRGLAFFCSGEASIWAPKPQMIVRGAGVDTLDDLTGEDIDFYHKDEAQNLSIGQANSQYNGTVTLRDVRTNGMLEFCEMLRYDVLRIKAFFRGSGGGRRATSVRMKQPTGQLYSAHTFEDGEYHTPNAAVESWFTQVRNTGVTVNQKTIAELRTETAWELNGTQIVGAPTGSVINVNRDENNPNWGLVRIWNHDDAATINVDLSSMLNVGNAFTVRHVFKYVVNPFDVPDVSGVYVGGTVSFPMDGFTCPPPLGETEQPRDPGRSYGAFIVERLAA